MSLVTTLIDSPLGAIRACANGGKICALWFEDARGVKGMSGAVEADAEVFERLRKWLALYFRGSRDLPTIPLLIDGTPFQKRVCDELIKIPYGATTTYGAIARAIADERGIPKMSAQAVGQAVGANPISLIIPCHRVLGAHEAITGYGGGLWRKRFLLALEGADHKG
jgi:methylated-DNA-[protein]-cysteine S-methyltransferase